MGRYKNFRSLAAILLQAGILGAVEGSEPQYGALVILKPEVAVRHVSNFVPKLQCCSPNHQIGVQGKEVTGPVPLYYFAWQGENSLCRQDPYALPVARLEAKHTMGYTVPYDHPEFENAFDRGEMYPVIPQENRTYVQSPYLRDTLLVDDDGFPLFESGAGPKRCLNGFPDPVFKA